MKKPVEKLFGFTILKYLGKGKSAYSYLIEYEGKPAVLKQIHYEDIDPTYQFEDNKLNHELNSYKQLQETAFLYPRLLTYDDENQYLIKEYIEGELLTEYIAKGEIDLYLYMSVLHAIMLAENKGINIDYYPTNFVIREGEFYYIDYETNQYSEEWDFRHWGIYMWMNVEGAKELVNQHSCKRLVTETGRSDCFEYHDYLVNAIDFIDTVDFHNLLKRDIIQNLHFNKFELVGSGMAATSFVIRTEEADMFIKTYKPNQKTSYHEEVSAFELLKDLMPKLIDYWIDEREHSYLVIQYVENKKISSDNEALLYAYELTEPLIKLHTKTQTDGETKTWLEEIIQDIDDELVISIKPEIKPHIEFLKQHLSEITNGHMAYLHGDYHLWNVLLTDDSSYLIDCHLRYGDIRLDVYWTYSLMKRSGFPKFAEEFLKIYKHHDPTIAIDEDYFIVLSNVLWFSSIIEEIKQADRTMFHEFSDTMFEIDIMKKLKK